MIYCDYDNSPNAFNSSYEPDFASCVNACHLQTSQPCGGVVYLGDMCYFKPAITSVSAGPGADSAVLVFGSGSSGSMSSSAASSSATSHTSAAATTPMMTTTSTSSSVSTTPSALCPARNGAAYVDAAGNGYTIYCNSDSTQGSFNSSVEPDFASCINACDLQSSCVAVAYTGSSVCYYKAQAGIVIDSPGVNLAVAANIFSTTTTTTSSSAVRTSTSGTATPSNPMAASSSSRSSDAAATSSSAAGGYNSPSASSSASRSSSTVSSSAPSVAQPSTTKTTTTTTTTSSSSPAAPPMSSSTSSERSSSPTSSAPSSSRTVTSSGNFYMSVSSPSASTSTLPACQSAAGSSAQNSNSNCADAYGNTYSVVKSTKQYTGQISKRATTNDVNECLTLCDTTPGCKAVNYVGTDCSLFTSVTGTTEVPGQTAVLATRPVDVSTVYTAPPTTTTSSMMMTAESIMSSGNLPSYGVMTSTAGYQASSPMMPTAPMTGTGSAMLPSGSSLAVGSISFSIVGGPSYTSTASMLLSTQATMGAPSHSSTAASVSLYLSTSASMGPNSPTGYPTMAAPSSSGMAGNQNGMNGAGNVASSAATRATSSGAASYSGGVSFSYAPTGASGPASPSATFSSAPTASACPAYDSRSYVDRNGATYTVQCNTAYGGTVINATTSIHNSYKRQVAASVSLQSCMAMCDLNPACVGVSVCGSTCTQYGSITSSTSSSACAAARKISGPSTASMSGVVTVTVCAAQPTGTLTVFTTATQTTCAANSVCTNGRRAEGFIAMI